MRARPAIALVTGLIVTSLGALALTFLTLGACGAAPPTWWRWAVIGAYVFGGSWLTTYAVMPKTREAA